MWKDVKWLLCAEQYEGWDGAYSTLRRINYWKLTSTDFPIPWPVHNPYSRCVPCSYSLALLRTIVLRYHSLLSLLYWGKLSIRCRRNLTSPNIWVWERYKIQIVQVEERYLRTVVLRYNIRTMRKIGKVVLMQDVTIRCWNYEEGYAVPKLNFKYVFFMVFLEHMREIILIM